MGAGPTTAEPRNSLDPGLRHELFGSSDESKYSSPGSKRSRSYSNEASAKHEDVSRHEDVDEYSPSHRSHSHINIRYRDDRGAISSVGTTQEETDRNALRSALRINHGCQP